MCVSHCVMARVSVQKRKDRGRKCKVFLCVHVYKGKDTKCVSAVEWLYSCLRDGERERKNTRKCERSKREREGERVMERGRERESEEEYD